MFDKNIKEDQTQGIQTIQSHVKSDLQGEQRRKTHEMQTLITICAKDRYHVNVHLEPCNKIHMSAICFLVLGVLGSMLVRCL